MWVPQFVRSASPILGGSLGHSRRTVIKRPGPAGLESAYKMDLVAAHGSSPWKKWGQTVLQADRKTQQRGRRRRYPFIPLLDHRDGVTPGIRP